MSMADEIWALLPEIYKRRDAEAGSVLRALVALFGEQAAIIHDDISRMYDNWFIETCDDWVIPYIGDLTQALQLSAFAGRQPERNRPPLSLSRRLVADAVRLRRRKGCFSIVETLAHEASQWPVQAIEFGTRLIFNQDINDPRLSHSPASGLTVSVRDPAALTALAGPDDPLARLIEVRTADAARAPGNYGPANLGVFVFTPEIVRVIESDAYCIDEEGSACFTFNPLGHDVPLYHPGAPLGRLPGRITRQNFARRGGAQPHPWAPRAEFYGIEGCIRIWIQPKEGDVFVPAEDRLKPVPGNLSQWRERPPTGQVAIDPELGRFAFSLQDSPNRARVTYCTAIPAAIGGGGYLRRPAPGDFDRVYKVSAGQEESHNSVATALAEWRKDSSEASGLNGLIEIQDSHTYDEDRLLLSPENGNRLVIRAVSGTMPTLRLRNVEAGAMDAWRVRGGGSASQGSSLILEGLIIAGRGISFHDYAGELHIRHCTLVPGWNSGERHHRHPDAPSLWFHNCSGPVTVSASILGAISVQADERLAAALPVVIEDSVIDAGENREAFLSASAVPYVALSMHRATVFGMVTVDAIALAENTIITGLVRVARRAKGCMRYCALPLQSRTPHRAFCVPREGVAEAAPVFVSTAYGNVGYFVLAEGCPESIAQGADDLGEMGVYHDLARQLRDANLRAVLAEYLPAGTAAGIRYMS